MELLRVPYESSKEKANFTVLATIEDTAASMSRCKEARYITSMHFGGAWFGGSPLEVNMDQGRMRALLGGVELWPSGEAYNVTTEGKVQLRMHDETQLRVGLGKQAEIVVTRDLQPVHFFLNVKATSLGELSYKIGGLLGEDDNADVSTPPAECHDQLMLVASKSGPRSDAAASI